ncbi:MAG: hypothetical protein QOH64_861 [Acidimicrobiaceae bacterium]
MRRAVPALVVTALAALALLVGGAMAGGASSGDSPLGPGTVTVHLTIQHSRFSPDRVQVRPGTTVRFVVDNRDPIGHELIIGDEDVHLRHESGTEAVHPPRPGEVSIAPRSSNETTFTFGDPGSVLFACHLPGHFAYGMSGYVNVVERAGGE